MEVDAANERSNNYVSQDPYRQYPQISANHCFERFS